MNQPPAANAPAVDTLDSFRVPIGNQAIELQQLRYPGGGMPLMRLRIREHSRFTIFEIDAVTARRWADTMGQWADQILEGNPASDERSE